MGQWVQLQTQGLMLQQVRPNPSAMFSADSKITLQCRYCDSVPKQALVMAFTLFIRQQFQSCTMQRDASAASACLEG